jgi:hypothetical protein
MLPQKPRFSSNFAGTKEFLKIHSETKGYVKFYCWSMGYVTLCSETKVSVKFL